MPYTLAINAPTIGAALRFLREDVPNWFAQPGKKPLLLQLSEVIDLWRRYKFVPYQYFKYDLYLRDVGPAYRNFIPSSIADDYIEEVNPPDRKHWLEDKLEFETRLEATDLPFVRTLAVMSVKKGALLIADDGNRAMKLDQMWRLAKSAGTRAVFVKPRLGSQGIGAFSLTVGETGFERDGARVSEGMLKKLLTADGFEYFLVQPYFEQHEALAQLNPRSVNTLRVMTLLAGDEVDLFCAYLRIGAGVNETDNGSFGGYCANVNLDTGNVGAVAKVDLAFAKRREAEVHPVTKVEFGSVKVPHVQAIKDLVISGARIFAPIRVIGWDVAIGKDGPVIIEANFYPGFRSVQDVCGGMRHTTFGNELAEKFNWR